jgi:hypothetical protein
VLVVIEGRDLPGRSFGPYADVHVALQVGADPVDPLPGDAPDGRWQAEVRVVDGDFRGPAVHGKRDERFLYLTWGSPTGDDWGMFRRAKLMLDPAFADAEVLVGKVSLTDEKGGPRCARVVPPAITWSRQASGARSL